MDKTRLFTGLALGFFTMFAIFLFPRAWFICIATVVVSLGALEICVLAKISRMLSRMGYLVLLWLCLGIAYEHNTAAIDLGVWVSVISCITIFLPKAWTRFLKKPTLLLIVGLLLLCPAWSCLVFLHETNRAYLFYFILLVTLTDIGAYYAGSRWGKHRLAPSLSPKKSIEGMIGGIIFSLIVANLYRMLCVHLHASWVYWTLISLITIGFSIMGDLFESLLKRQVDIKDTGSLFPGHGGMLDRIDSLLIAAPLFALLSTFMGFL